MTVSELKRAYREEEAGELVFDEAVVPLLPKFTREEEELTGASRGSIIDCWNCLISKKYDEVTLKELIEEQKRSGKLSEEMCTYTGEGYLRFKHTCRREKCIERQFGGH